MSAEDFTPKLGLPYLLPNQAQKHVTVNESLGVLDGLVMASVEATGTDTPPQAPQAGQGWIVGEAPEGAWTGHATAFAIWRDGAWGFSTPQAGWRIWDKGTGQLRVFDGQVWTGLRAETQNLTFIGIGTTGDADNPFAARLNTALWTALESEAGGTGNLRLTLNKEAAASTASLVFQSGWSGRAELGLTGDEAFSLRVSDNGADWQTAWQIDQSTGHVGFGLAPQNGDRVTISGSMECWSDSGSFRLRPFGLFEMNRELGKPIFIRANSDGSNVVIGARDSNGVSYPSMISVRPDQQDIEIEVPVVPAMGAVTDLGRAGTAFRDLYLTNAPIISSDLRGKQDVEDLFGALSLIEFLRPVSYRREEGGARHFGFIAQETALALQAVDYQDAALWSLADPEDGNSQQGLRLEELIAVLVGAVQVLSEQVARLNDRAA